MHYIDAGAQLWEPPNLFKRAVVSSTLNEPPQLRLWAIISPLKSPQIFSYESCEPSCLFVSIISRPMSQHIFSHELPNLLQWAISNELPQLLRRAIISPPMSPQIFSYMSHHIVSYEPSYLLLWVTTSSPMSHHISPYEPEDILLLWTIISSPTSHHISSYESPHLLLWAIISSTMSHIFSYEPSYLLL